MFCLTHAHARMRVCAHTHTHILYITDLLNATSKQFDGGTSLHIAAANLNLQATKTLVSSYTNTSCVHIPVMYHYIGDCFIRVFR